MDFSPLNTEAFTVTFSRVSHIEGTRMPMDVFTDTYRFSFAWRTQCWVQFKLHLLFVSPLSITTPVVELTLLGFSLCSSSLPTFLHVASLFFFLSLSRSLSFTSIPPFPPLAHRGNRQEAHSLQERKQVLEDAHLLSSEEQEFYSY